MTDCNVCSRKVDGAFMCGSCRTELTDLLTGLAVGWRVDNGHRAYTSGSYLEFLADAVHGKTRLGESARRSTDKTSPLMAHLKASELFADATHTLSMWAQTVSLATETLTEAG